MKKLYAVFTISFVMLILSCNNSDPVSPYIPLHTGGTYYAITANDNEVYAGGEFSTIEEFQSVTLLNGTEKLDFTRKRTDGVYFYKLTAGEFTDVKKEDDAY